MLRLNIGSSQKIGQPNYGSRGASLHFEVELESALLRDPEQLQEKVRELFGLARDSVQEELAAPVVESEVSQTSDQRQNNNGATNGHAAQSASHPGAEAAQPRPATTSQVRAIYAIAARHRVDLETHLQDKYRVSVPADLSLPEASRLIDSLKAETSPAGGRR